jgi:hypothetical protein
MLNRARVRDLFRLLGHSCYHWLKLETVQGLVWEPLWTSLVKSHKTSSSVTAVLRGDLARHQGS